MRTPRWAVATSVVLALAILFVNLGLWQLRRHDERALENQVISARLTDPHTPLVDLIAAAGEDVSTLEYRRASVSGVYHPELELLIRNMTNLGEAGFHVITPMETADGVFVLVNRGWVPLVMDRPPVGAVPPASPVTVEGLVRLTQLRPAVGQVEPEGVLAVASRLDIDRLSQQIPGQTLPVWLQATGGSEALPVGVEVPDFSDPGPHFLYALQWFAFALIGVVGFGFLARNQAQGSRRRKQPAAV